MKHKIFENPLYVQIAAQNIEISVCVCCTGLVFIQGRQQHKKTLGTGKKSLQSKQEARTYQIMHNQAKNWARTAKERASHTPAETLHRQEKAQLKQFAQTSLYTLWLYNELLVWPVLVFLVTRLHTVLATAHAQFNYQYLNVSILSLVSEEVGSN